LNGRWSIEHQAGPAELLHHESVAALAGPRAARILHAESPALVLGSSQPASDVDAGAAHRHGIAVVKRRTGGGAVLVGPGLAVWVDFVVPAGDPLWDDDVRRAAWWVGDLWVRALEQIGVGPTEVWRAGLVRRTWSEQLCFAGIGPGEVLVGDRKVVGVSQRRTRSACLFQTAVLLQWDPALMVELLAGDGPPGEVPALEELVLTIPVGAEGPLVDALIDQLTA
jgi:lipoate---protein ligase